MDHYNTTGQSWREKIWTLARVCQDKQLALKMHCLSLVMFCDKKQTNRNRGQVMPQTHYEDQK